MQAVSDDNAKTADDRLEKLRTRDRGSDGDFVYAVRTTGIYCRPSCAARPARVENIAFYATPIEAEAAGFRPCKRCRPAERRDPLDEGERMGELAAYISAHADESLTLDRLGKIAGMSPFHLQRVFKSVLGVSPKSYQAARRLENFKAGLRAGDDIVGAVFEAGYGSTSRVYERVVSDGIGMTPSAYRAGGAGELIVYAIRQTSLGLLMMAATERGVCSVQFGEDAERLHRQLAAEFPKAELTAVSTGAEAGLNDWMAALEAHLCGDAPKPDLPLELRGTAFQIRVWRFLLGVRSGQVVSYTALAQGIGAPGAVRAAASACGANRLGVLVPCHRVLRSDGGLGGYRWGLGRKRALLDLEQRTTHADVAR